LLEGTFVVRRFPKGQAIPAGVLDRLRQSSDQSGLLSITWSDDEVTVVRDASSAAAEQGPQDDSPRWRCIKIKGPMDFGLTGVLASFTSPLKEAGVPIFAISTWSTDFMLVPEDKINEAVEALKADGWQFE